MKKLTISLRKGMPFQTFTGVPEGFRVCQDSGRIFLQANQINGRKFKQRNEVYIPITAIYPKYMNQINDLFPNALESAMKEAMQIRGAVTIKRELCS